MCSRLVAARWKRNLKSVYFGSSSSPGARGLGKVENHVPFSVTSFPFGDWIRFALVLAIDASIFHARKRSGSNPRMHRELKQGVARSAYKYFCPL